MKVYKYISSQKTMQLAAIDEGIRSGHPIDSDFNGEKKEDIWSPVEVETLYKKQYHNFPHYRIGKPVVSKKVKDILLPYVTNEIEFLPLLHKDLELYMINVTNVLDCVDWKRSDVKWWKDGSFFGFNKIVFDFDKIPENTYMFKFKELATVSVYVTDAFKELIENHKLKGLDFSDVYDSEFTLEKELEQTRAYEAALLAIEDNKGLEFSYDEARARVEQNQAVASGKWRMQMNKAGEFCLGELLPDLTWEWIIPYYMPPVLLGYFWHEAERIDI